MAAVVHSPSVSSPTATEEFPPLQAGSFIHLKPDNQAALVAFHDVAQAMLDNKYLYQRHFTHIDDKQTSWAWPASGSGSTTDSSSTETASHDPVILWTGYFFLSLAIIPEESTKSWRLGCGRWHDGDKELRKPFGEVEILLTVRNGHTGVRGNHGQFFFNRETGMLMLRSNHGLPNGITLAGENFSKDHRALNRRTVSISIGRLDYQLVYTITPGSPEDVLFRAQKSDFFKSHLRASSPFLPLSTTPAMTDHIVGGWVLHAHVGEGGHGLVTAVSDKTGRGAVAKTMVRSNRDTAQTIAREVHAATELKTLLDRSKHKERIVRLQEVIYQYGSSFYMPDTVETVWILYAPLARGTVISQILRKAQPERPSTEAILILFKQVLEGLLHLHELSWVHRDIKPANLGIISVEPPKAVILDLGCARRLPHHPSRKIPHTPGRVGTINYLAPEMERQPYDEAVDIWALGLVAHELFCGRHPWPSSINPWLTPPGSQRDQHYCDHANTLLRLRKAGRADSVEDLIAKMLALDPHGRPSAWDAMNHACFRPIAERWEEMRFETAHPGEKRHAG